MSSPDKITARADHKSHNPVVGSGPKRNRSVGPVDVDTDELSRKGQRKDDLSRRAAPPTPPMMASKAKISELHDRFAAVIGKGGSAPAPKPETLSSGLVRSPVKSVESQQTDNANKSEVPLVVPKQHPPPLVNTQAQFPTPISNDEVEEVGTIYPLTSAPVRRTHQPYSSAYSGYFSNNNNQNGHTYGSTYIPPYNSYAYAAMSGRPPSYSTTGLTQESYRSTSASHSQAGRNSEPLSAPPSYSTLGLTPLNDEQALDSQSPLTSPTYEGDKPRDSAYYEGRIAAMAAEISYLQTDNRRLREALDISRRSCAELEKLYGRRSGDVIRLQAQLRSSAVTRNTSPPPLSTLSSEEWTDPTAPPPQPLPPPQIPSNASGLEAGWARSIEDAAAVTSVVVHPSTQSKRYYCEVCNVLVNSEVSLKAHLEGDKHRKGQYRLQYRRGGAAGGFPTSQSLPRSDTNYGEMPPELQ